MWWACDTIAPTEPVNLKILDETSNSVTIDWDASVDNSKITRYDIYLDDTFYGAALDDTQYTLTDLDFSEGDEYKIYIIARDDALNTSDPGDSLSIKEEQDDPTALLFERETPWIIILPNPVSDDSLMIETTDKVQVNITDVHGRIVLHDHLNSGTTKVSTNDLKNGIYVVTVKTNTHIRNMRLIVN